MTRWLAVLFFVPSFIFAAVDRDEKGNTTENYSASGLKLYVHSPRTRYYATDSVPVELMVLNDGLYPVTVFLHRNPAKNFTPVIRLSSGKSIPLKENPEPSDFERTHFGNYTGTNYHSRAVVLQPGESFTRNFSLSDFTDADLAEFTSNGSLSVMAYFYPNPEQDPSVFVSGSNHLSLILDPPAKAQNTEMYFSDSADSLPDPSETIYLLLTAEYSGNWSRYFKYVSLPDIIRDYPDYAEKYMRTSAAGKQSTLEEFRSYLMTRGNIKKFQVIQSDASAENSGKVEARVRRIFDGFEREFLYTYYLSRKKESWQVTGIESQIIR